MPLKSQRYLSYWRAVDIGILSCILIFCFAYVVWGSNFAETGVYFSVFNFPVFLGEILLGFCLCLWVLRQWLSHERFNLTQGMWFFYLTAVVIKAIFDYVYWGPLALRNAALFYYPMFAFLTMQCFKPEILNQQRIFIAIVVFIFLLAAKIISGYFWLTGMLLTVILILMLKQSPWRWVLLFLLLLTSHVNYIFMENRTHLLGALGAVIVITALILKSNLYPTLTKYRYYFVFGLIIILVAGIKNFSDLNGVKSLMMIDKLIEEYSYQKMIIHDQEDLYQQKKRPVKIYASNKDIIVQQFVHDQEDVLEVRRDVFKKKMELPKDNALASTPVAEKETGLKYRSIEGACNNILFRWFIWEDMWQELWDTRAIMGVGLGKPQRSKNIEILGWALSEWSRDGWIAMHNSFLQVIYRTGIVGLILLIFLFSVFFHLIKQFVIKKSLIGIVFIGIFTYWIIGANFGVVLELPYFAIPIWSLAGIMLAYAKRL